MMNRDNRNGPYSITTWCKCALLIVTVLLSGRPALGRRIPKMNVFALEFSPDGRQLAAALGVTDYDVDDLYHEVRIWNVSDWSVAASWREPDAYCLGYSPDGRFLAVGTMMGRGVVIRDLTTHYEVSRLVLLQRDDWVSEVRFSQNGKYLAVDVNEFVVVWDIGQLANPQEIGRTPVVNTRPAKFAFADDGKSLVYSTEAGAVQVVDLPAFTLRRQTKLSPIEEGTVFETFDRAGRQLLTTTDRYVQTWNVEANRALPTVSKNGSAIGSVFSHNGRRFAFVTARRDDSPEQFVRVFDVNSPKELQRFPYSSSTLIRTIALSPDGSMVAAGGAGAEDSEDTRYPIKVWDVDSGEIAAELYYDQSSDDETSAASLTWVFVVVAIALLALLLALATWLRRRAAQRRQTPQ